MLYCEGSVRTLFFYEEWVNPLFFDKLPGLEFSNRSSAECYRRGGERKEFALYFPLLSYKSK